MPKKPTYEELEQRVNELVQTEFEHKRIEEAMRESEGRFSAMFEHMSSGVAAYESVDNGEDFVFKAFNPAAERITHISQNEALGNRLLDIFPHMDKSGFLGALQRVWKTGREEHLPPFYYKDEIREGWRENRIYMLPTGEIVALFDDVTERKQAEEALRESEEKYRQLSDSLPQIVFETDEKGNLTFTNRMAFDILGYTREDFERGLNALQMLIPEDHDRALKNIQRVLKGEKLGGIEYTALTKDGRRYPAVVYSTPIISEGKSVGMRGIVADLTEVEQAQKALLESEERLRIAGKAAYDLIYEWDVASEALEWFGDVDGLLGYRKGEISRDINAWLDLINPEDRVTLENAVELHKTSTESIQYEYRVRP